MKNEYIHAYFKEYDHECIESNKNTLIQRVFFITNFFLWIQFSLIFLLPKKSIWLKEDYFIDVIYHMLTYVQICTCIYNVIVFIHSAKKLLHLVCSVFANKFEDLTST